ncbi:MerC domain-containing protein [Sphingosinicella sp. LHD-64]|uniref:MerC domain-containing protein n=1 Tax=Sphingosinicella sp. LHD-64 TaxID=3072139 RepID=UPI00280F5F87|nr:MerC domain-containing protein [Sphingosinicella sp. LHD-64]MDQ8756291.1 MerC domain-containing protein [Sphingosinicella sp. LHD-64]
MPALIPSRTGDALAIGLSGLCLVHCLALPVLASLLPMLGAWTQAEWVHWGFAAVAAPVSLWTLTRPNAAGPSKAAIALASAGIALLFAGAAELPTHDAGTPVTVAGSLLLATAHLLNWRRRGGVCAKG